MKRVVIYVQSAKDGDLRRQEAQCILHVLRNGEQLVSISTEEPGQRKAWDAAVTLVDEGRADAIVLASDVSPPTSVPVERVGDDEGRRPNRL